MKKLQLSFLIVTTLFLASCSNELEEISNNADLSNINSNTTQAQVGIQKTMQNRLVTNTYIVVFKDNIDVDIEARNINNQHGGTILHRYKHAIKGIAIANLPAQAIEALKNNPKVDYIEQDQEVFAIATSSWGLDRIDQRSLPLDKTYTYSSTASNVDAYIIDTGINEAHTEFGTRVRQGTDVIDGTFVDGNGHGTHVSGTVGGSTYGVAKSVNLVEVRVLNSSGSGTISGVIAGVDWVTADHLVGVPAVANMSLGGGASSALDAAVRNSIADGVVYCVAAGNSKVDAKNSSPARVSEAITVAASDINDRFASYSNYGSLIDLIAPGTNITSAWIGSTTASNTISGTSMATPHVTGAAALYLSGNTSASPSAVQSALKANATQGKISYVPRGTVNALLFVN